MAAVLGQLHGEGQRGEEGSGDVGQEIARIPLPVKLQCCGDIKGGNTSESLLQDAECPAAARFAAVARLGARGCAAGPMGCTGDAATFPTLLPVMNKSPAGLAPCHTHLLPLPCPAPHPPPAAGPWETAASSLSLLPKLWGARAQDKAEQFTRQQLQSVATKENSRVSEVLT